MTTGLPGRGRMLGVAVVALAYAVLAHISNSNPNAHALGVVLAVGPLAIALCVFLWRTGQRVIAAQKTLILRDDERLAIR